MLIDPQGRKLGDKSLSKQEQLQRLKENTNEQLESRRFPDQKAFKDAERRMGRPMLHTQLFDKVHQLSSRIVMETSNNDSTVAGFYQMLPDGSKKFICAFHMGWMPEFSIITVDERNLPKGERRGWRTVLLRLIQAKCLTYQQVIETFGYVEAQDVRGKYWNMYSKGY